MGIVAPTIGREKLPKLKYVISRKNNNNRNDLSNYLTSLQNINRFR